MANKINKNIEGIYGLTPMQEGMLFHKQLKEDSTQYVLQNILRIHDALSEKMIQDSLKLLMYKYDVLRTVFFYKKTNKPKQIVLKEKEIEFHCRDLTMFTQNEQRKIITQIQKDDLERGFLLEKDSLLRLTLIRISNQECVLIWNSHHIIMDGWCISLLLTDFMGYYRKLHSGLRFEDVYQIMLEEKSGIASYSQYIEWLKKQDQASGMAYWNKLLMHYSGGSEIMPLHRPRSAKDEMNEEVFSMTSSETNKIKAYTAENNITVSTLLETAWGIILQKYNRSSDIVFGKVVSGRNAAIQGIEHAVGLFINTVPVRINARPGTTVMELLKLVQQQSIESSAHDFCSLAEIQASTKLGTSLIHSIIAYENYYVNDNLDSEMNDFCIEIEKLREQTNYQITLTAYIEDSMTFKIMYDPGIYTDKEIKLILKRLDLIIKQCIEMPHNRIDQISILDNYEKNLVLYEYNQTDAHYPAHKTVVDLFEESVYKNPDGIAVKYKGQGISYRELNRRANCLAHLLRKRQVCRNDSVAIVLERSIEQIVGILGIIKAGAAYVPIDPGYPAHRIEYILNDCSPKLVLTGDNHCACIDGYNMVNLFQHEDFMEEEDTNPIHINTPDDLIYIIYTSGTTGRPKGVMLEHRNVTRLLFNDLFQFSFDSRDIWTLFHSICFDFSVWEIFGSILYGGQLVIVPSEVMSNPREFMNLLEEEKVTVVNQVPSAFYGLMAADFEAGRNALHCVKYLIFGGEALRPGKLKEWVKKYPNQTVINMYGITETTVHVTYKKIGWEEIQADISTVGRAIPTLKIYIMNGQELCGIGIPGEICVTGAGVARGYKNQPDLTQQKFVKHPFGKDIMYRSGDLGRWNDDGNLEYLGRIDEQVKVRGFRIELGEIESVIRETGQVEDVVAVAQVDSMEETYIGAYIVSKTKINIESLRLMISRRLTDYMMPALIIQMESIPVTANGKLDRNSLPKIGQDKTCVSRKPQSSLEIQVLDVFKEVLGIPSIALDDNFFLLGGHSLRATRAVNKIEAVTGSKILLKDFFLSPTAEGVCRLLDKQEKGNYIPIPKADYQEMYAMSCAQKRLFVMQEFDQNSTSYHMPSCLQIDGELDIVRMRAAFKSLIIRHEAMRTSFRMSEGEAVQIIKKEAELEIEILNGQESDDSLFHNFIRPFNLSKPPLFRVRLIIISKNKSYLLFDMHHIISDGMSANILIHDFCKLYENQSLNDIKLQYKDYSEWMRKRDLSVQKNYWLQQFSDQIPVLDMPLDYPRNQEISYAGDQIDITFDKDTYAKIKDMSTNTGTTEYMILLAGLMILLSRYSREDDIVVGTPISGRTHKDTEGVMGVFVNTLAMRANPSADKPFLSFLDEVKGICLNAYENQEYPFDELINEVGAAREMTRNPLFDVMFTMQNNENVDFTMDGLKITPLPLGDVISKFDLSVDVYERKGSYDIIFQYSKDLFQRNTIEYFARHYRNLIVSILSGPDKQIGSLLLTDQQEINLIKTIFNPELQVEEEVKGVIQLFEEQVIRTPYHIAVTDKWKSYTYEKMNCRVNMLTNRLIEAGVSKGSFVAIITQRTAELLVGIYAVLKAGAAYVPIDPDYPNDRKDMIIADCRPVAILVGKTSYHYLEIPVIDLFDEGNYIGKAENRKYECQLDCLAYMIYTSGTTGIPKGVMIKHRNLISFCKSMAEHLYQPNRHEHIALLSSFCFDASIEEIFLPLIYGHTVHVVSEDIYMLGDKLIKFFEDNNITIIHCTPTHHKIILQDVQRTHWTVNTFVIGGEALPVEIVKRIYEINEGRKIRILNTYGPTEATVDAAVYLCRREDSKRYRIPIGKPLSNTQIYILDNGILCGVGIPGELCIAGGGLALGYFNREELTNEKFTKNLYGEGRLYHTGDLVSWLSDGNIEYLGRIDDQVKIRGYRIELGEIEAAIKMVPGVRDAVAVITQDQFNESKLCAYFVSEYIIEISEIKKEISKSLPVYMIPHGIMQIDEIPMTISGKLSKSRLPVIQSIGVQDYVKPQSEKDQVLINTAQEIMGVKNPGMLDDFFELGGDSIKAIRMVTKLREKGYQLSVKDIMKHHIMEQISAHMQLCDGVFLYEQGEVTGEVSYTPIQSDFFSRQYGNPNHFNQAICIKASDSIDPVISEKAIKALVQHHDILRAVFEGGIQKILPISECSLIEFSIADVTQLRPDERYDKIETNNTRLQKSMDITKGPLVKACLYKTGNVDHLMICIHHLLIDGVSWRILLDDFKQAYQQAKSGCEIKLPMKTASYKNWADTLADYAGSDQLKSDIPYWDRIDDMSRMAVMKWKEYNGGEIGAGRVKAVLEEVATEDLKFRASKAFGTEVNDLLLAALGIAIKNWCDQDKIAVNMEGHGREPIHKPIVIDRTIGWFTSIYPILLNVSGELDQTIIDTKEMLRKVPGNGIGYGILKAFGKLKDPNTEIKLSFNYLGDFDENQIGLQDFEESEISAGQSIADINLNKSGISITCSITNHRMEIDICFDKSEVSVENIKELSVNYIAALNQVINTCISKKEIIKTVSDMTKLDISTATLDEISGMLDY